mgnify:CR=1 FL=1
MKKALAAALCGVLFTATMTVPVLADDADYAGMKIVLILPGSIDDQSWNASNNAGAKECDEELGTSIEVVESVPVEEFESTFTEYGEKGYDLVMAAGSQFDEASAAVAPQYPDTVYTVINGTASLYSRKNMKVPILQVSSQDTQQKMVNLQQRAASPMQQWSNFLIHTKAQPKKLQKKEESKVQRQTDPS